MPSTLSLILRGIRETGLRPAWNSVAHAVRTRWVEAKFADPDRPLRGLPLLRETLCRLPVTPQSFPPAGPVRLTPGPLLSLQRDGRDLILTFRDATVVLTVLAADVIRLRVQRGPTDWLAYTIARPDADWPPCPFDVVETVGSVDMRTERLTCSVSRTDGRVRFLDPEGNPVAEDAVPVGWTAGGHVVWGQRLPPDARVYGLGQRAAALDRRGGCYVNWNTDPRTYDLGDDPLNLCIPFLLVLHAGGRQGWGLLLENTTRSRVDVGQVDPAALAVEVEESALGYVFFYGPSLATVLERYTELTGRVPLFPTWALGYHQSRWSYFPDSRVRRLAREFRETHRVPCDAVHLDIHYMDGYRCFTWDAERFPDPVGLVAELHGQGFRVVPIVDPGIKVDRRYPVFRDGLEREAFCRYPDGKPFVGPVWPGNCTFPDFTAPPVREWWAELCRDFARTGVDGLWADMNEPALFGEDGATIPAPAQHDLDGRGGDHRQAHNVYGLLMARATAEGLQRSDPQRRPFVLTRSGWAGVQRYAAHWTGDNRSSWESLRLTLPMVLGLGLSGVGFTGADVGGFAGTPDGELFARWLQLGVFLPFFRAHTHFANPAQEPWSWGEPTLSINRETIGLRYRLLPYLYTALWQCARSGMPMTRPLALTFQEDTATHDLEDTFMCGDALLVAPVLEQGATSRAVYLPSGCWYDFWTSTQREGPGWIEAEAPLQRIPIFVRGGAVVPLGPAVEHVGQRRGEPLELHLYPAQAPRRFSPGEPTAQSPPAVSWLYEDDGETTAHERGEFRLTRFTLATAGARLELLRELEGRFEPPDDRVVVVVHGADGPPLAVEGMPGAEPVFDTDAGCLRLTGGLFDRLSLTWP